MRRGRPNVSPFDAKSTAAELGQRAEYHRSRRAALVEQTRRRLESAAAASQAEGESA